MEMGLRYTQLFTLVVLIASMFAVGSANKNLTKGPDNWNFGFNYTNWPFGHHNFNQTSRRIIVGGSEKWHFGFNYTDSRYSFLCDGIHFASKIYYFVLFFKNW